MENSLKKRQQGKGNNAFLSSEKRCNKILKHSKVVDDDDDDDGTKEQKDDISGERGEGSTMTGR